MLFGLSVFDTKVDELIEKINSTTNVEYKKDDIEIPYAYRFLDLGLYLWREYLPDKLDDKEESQFYRNFEFIGIGLKEK